MHKKIYYVFSGLVVSIVTGIIIASLFSSSIKKDYEYQSNVNIITAPCIEAARMCSKKADTCEEELSNQISNGPGCKEAQSVCYKGNKICSSVLSELDDLDFIYGAENETVQKP